MHNPATTLVLFAVKEEARPFIKLSASHPEVEVALTGMGRANAEQVMAARLASRPPQRVITAGFAGGLDPDLRPGQVLYDLAPTSGLLEALARAGARPGRFHCAERVISTAVQKRALRDQSGADAVEMESGAISSLCRRHDIPVAVIRVILDPASEDLALDFNQVMTPDLRIASGRLALYLLKAPWKIPALLRLQHQSAAAASSLALVLARVLF